MPDQTSRRDGLTTSLGVKAPVRVATTAALALLSGLQTIDGVVLAAGDRVLVKDQANTVNNGIYDVNSGNWTRSKDADGNLDLAKGTSVIVTDGATNGGLFYKCTAANPIVIGTTALTWALTNPTSPLSLPIAIAQGGTGQTSADKALAALGVIGLTGAGGTANAQTATAPAGMTAFATNQLFEYTPAVTNTGAVNLTITPSGSGALLAKNVFYDGAACAGSELVANVPTLLLYDGVQFHIVGYSRKIRGSELGMDTHVINGTVAASVAASALTVAVKTLAGADPSPADPVGLIFRNATNATGDYTVLWLTAATSVVISSGSTLGSRDNVTFRLWLVAFNDAGTVRLGLINCVTTAAGAGTANDVTSIFRLANRGIGSSTAEGGAGAADSPQIFYTGTAVANKAYTPIAYLTWNGGLVTAGTWASGPTTIQLFGPNVPLPGQTIQRQRVPAGTVATGTTILPADNTIPQNTEGDQYMTTGGGLPVGTAGNVDRIKAKALAANSAAAPASIAMALFQDAAANALAATEQIYSTTSGLVQLYIEHMILHTSQSVTTINARIGGSAAGTTTFNGSGGTQRYGGVANSFIEIEELQG